MGLDLLLPLPLILGLRYFMHHNLLGLCPRHDIALTDLGELTRQRHVRLLLLLEERGEHCSIRAPPTD